MRHTICRLVSLNGMGALFILSISLILCPLSAGNVFAQDADEHPPFCEPIDLSPMQPESSESAGKRAFSLNTGDPRTVRVIYFVPNDRSFSSTVEDSIKRAVRRVRAFFTEQMTAHGFGSNAINIETGDDGEPLIHRVEGQHGDEHYADGTHFTVFNEIRQNYDTRANIYVAFIDNSRLFTQMGGRSGKTGGEASLRTDFKWQTLAHELGHTFGLHHDFRDNRYVMSYGDEQDSLSVCAAEFLSVHPYLNHGITTESSASPTIELISSPKFLPDADNISVRFKVVDTDGLHQLILFTPTPPLNWGSGYPEVKAWRGLAKRQNSEVELEYRRDIVSTSATPANPAPEEIHINVVDTDGNVRQVSYNLVSISPYSYATFEGHADAVVSVTFSPAATILASASNDNTVRLWDVSTGTTVSTLYHTRNVTSVSFSPDGSILASGSYDGHVRLWDVTTGDRVTTLEGHVGEVRSLSFSPDGATLVSGSYDNTVTLWNVGAGTKIATLVGHTDGVLSVLFSPDGKILASSSWDNTVRLWSVATGRSLATLSHSHQVSSMSFTPDGSKLASGSHDNRIRFWDVLTGEQTDTLEGHTDDVSSVSFSPDETTLASGSDDKTVRLWRVDTGRSIGILTGHTGGIGRLLFSPDGSLLATTSWDNSVKLWDMATGESLATLLHSRTVNSTSFSSDGRFLASGSDDKTVELWDMSAWARPRARSVTKISGDNQEGVTGGPLMSPLIVEVRDQYGEPLSGAQVTFTVIAGDGSFSSGFTTVNATTGPDGRAQVVLTLGSNPGPNTVRASITDLQVETFNAVGLGSSVVTDNALDYPTWHLPRGATLRMGRGTIGKSDRGVAFSPDGNFVAVASGIGVWLYAVGDPESVMLLPSGVVHSLSFSPDGRTLVSTGGWRWEGEVRLWDVATGTKIAIVETAIPSPPFFSPDGNSILFATGYVLQTGHLTHLQLDAATGKQIDELHVDRSLGRLMTMSRDGTTLAFGAEDGSISLWDVATGTRTVTLDGHQREAESVSFSPDGKTLASVSVDRTVRLWDVASGTQSAVLPDHYCGVSSVAFSPDGATLASGGWDGKVILWDAATGRNIVEFNRHADLVRAVSFSPDGTILATASEDGDVLLLDVATGNATAIPSHTGPVWSMAFSPDGTTLASSSSSAAEKVDIWDAPTGRMIARLGRAGCSRTVSVTFSPDGTTLASASLSNGVVLWDLHNRNALATFPHTFQVSSASFSPDGTTLASGDFEGNVYLWDVKTERKIRTLTGPQSRLWTLLFSPDGATLAAGTAGGDVRLWDVTTGATIRDLERQLRAIRSMAFSSDGVTLATSSDQHSVKLWDLATGAAIATLKEGGFDCVAFSPDGTMFATGGQDRRVRLYDMSTGDIVATFEGHNHYVSSVFFTPDGKTLASGSYDGTILLWDLKRLDSAPDVLKEASGVKQKAPAGTALKRPFVVTVRDENGEPYAGAVVTFAVTAGGGTLSVTTDTTDASGNAATTLTLGTRPGTNTVVATVANLEPVTFTAIGKANPDFDGDGTVGFGDFLLFAERFGLSQDADGYEARYDLDGNGAVGFSDFLIFAGNFGKAVGG